VTAQRRYQLVVVGAGVAGSEVAYAAAAAGVDTLLVTTSLDTVYNLAAPRALAPPVGTLMARLVPAAGTPEVFALHRSAKGALEALPNLHLLQSNVEALESDGSAAVGVRTWEGVPRYGAAVALCAGSFLGARLTLGRTSEPAGRLGEMAYDELYDDLSSAGFRFDTAVSSVEGFEGRPSYRVTYRCFADNERRGRGGLRRLERLYAAGRCLDGEATPELRAEHGRDLGLHLVELVGSEGFGER
jgi:tRNA U34 5-carboxymethylaminomethyl modifying enzyme MnmG/GidA